MGIDTFTSKHPNICPPAPAGTVQQNTPLSIASTKMVYHIPGKFCSMLCVHFAVCQTALQCDNYCAACTSLQETSPLANIMCTNFPGF
jgi:hypothetical protein